MPVLSLPCSGGHFLHQDEWGAPVLPFGIWGLKHRWIAQGQAGLDSTPLYGLHPHSQPPSLFSHRKLQRQQPKAAPSFFSSYMAPWDLRFSV